MEILLLRNRFYKTHTIGQLYIDGVYFCFVLEDVIRPDPNPDTPWNEAKVQDETAIPEGKYEIILENSGLFGPDTPTLRNVPGYQYIRVHAGNTDKNTKGCLILGYKLADNGVIAVGSTKPAVIDFKGKVKQAIQSGKRVYITIQTVQN